MVQVTYPGVYVVEVPSGVHTIAGVSTSVAAFVDRFARGPDNKAVQIFGPGDFNREFGGLAAYSPASYAIQQFFQNGGSEAWVVRVGRSGQGAGSPPADHYAAAAVTLYDTSDPSLAGPILHVYAGRRVGGVSVENPGAWGNSLRVEVDYNTAALPNTNIDPANIEEPTELFNLTVSQVEMRNGQAVVVQRETFSNLTMRPDVPNNAVQTVNEGSKLVQLETAPGFSFPPGPLHATDAVRPLATGTTGMTPTITSVPTSSFKLITTVDPDGTLSTFVSPSKTVTVLYPSQGAPTTFGALAPLLEAAIRASGPNDPLIAGATVRYVQPEGIFHVRLGGGDPAATITFSNAVVNNVTDSAAGDLGLAGVDAAQSALSGGDDGVAITDLELVGDPNLKTGMYALEDVSLFNLLCLPAAAELVLADTTGVTMRSAYAAAAAYCESRRAFLLVDIPEGTDSLADMQDWLDDNDGLRHRNAAVYFPRVRVADPLNRGRLRSLAASGTMAGVYARTDSTRGVWKAPAGIEATLSGVQALAVSLTDRENGALNPLGVNVLRTFPVYGTVCWGARTLEGADQRASEWKYVPIRRLALFLEESLFRGTKWVVFEPNDEPLWAQIRMNLNAFMMGLFRQGAFQGGSPKEAFFVKCDGQTTTQNDRNLGIVNIEVGFAPLKPAEFVILKIQQIAGDLG